MARKNTRRIGMKGRPRGRDGRLLPTRQSPTTTPDIAENMHSEQDQGDINIASRKPDSLDSERLAISEGETATLDACRTEQFIASENDEVEGTDTLNTHQETATFHARQPDRVIGFNIYHNGQSGDTHQQVASSNLCGSGETTTLENYQDGETANPGAHEEIEQAISNADQSEQTITPMTHQDSKSAVSDTAISNANGSEETTTPKAHQDRDSTVLDNNAETEIATFNTHQIDQPIGANSLDAGKSTSSDSAQDSETTVLEVDGSGNQKHVKNNSQKRKSVKEPSATTSQPLKRARSASSEPTHRQQFESPFQIPLATTERMQLIKTHETKRILNYMPNRTSAVLKPDGTQNNTNVEAHLIQERGNVFTSRCNSCGNKGRPAGPWKECVALEGFLKGSCANCHVNGLGKRCSLRPQDILFHVPSKNARIAAKSTSKVQRGGSEEFLIQQLMAMDSDSREDLEDKANDMLNALRKARSRLRKLRKEKGEKNPVTREDSIEKNEGEASDNDDVDLGI